MQQNIISLKQAHSATARVVAMAMQDGNPPVCLCVVDGAGQLLHFSRMDGAPARLIPIVLAKAYTALRMGCPTETFRERLHNEQLTLADFCDPGFTSLPGGIPITMDGMYLGAVGVSGRALSDDSALAKTYAQILYEMITTA